MVGRVLRVLVLLVALAVTALAQDRDWAKHYGNRWNLNLDHARPNHGSVKSSSSSRQRGDMSPHDVSRESPQDDDARDIQPIEVDTSYIDSAAAAVWRNTVAAPPTQPPIPRRTPPPQPTKQDQNPRRTPHRTPPPQPPKQDQNPPRTPHRTPPPQPPKQDQNPPRTHHRTPPPQPPKQDQNPRRTPHRSRPPQRDQNPHRTPQRPRPPQRDQNPRRTPQRPRPPQRDQNLQGDGPRIFINPGSRMSADERKAIFTKYKTVLQLAEGLNKDLAQAKRQPLCGADGPTTTLDSLQSSIGVVQASLEILIRVIRDSFTEVSLATNIYQNLEVCYELLVSIKVTTVDVMSQLVLQKDQGTAGALTMYCPSPYQVIGGQCLYIHTTSTATWFQARTECKRRKGDLAVPHNLLLLQARILTQRPDQRSLEFWLGGSDLINEHEWKWVSGDAMDMTKGWNPGEPNNDNRRGGEDCVMLLDKEYPPMNDARCEKDYLHYICEVPLSDQIQLHPQPPTSAPKIDEDCGGDVRSGPGCFHVSSSTEYVPWFKARQSCKDKGGSLAQSHTPELSKYIMDRCGEKRWFWMGPSDLDSVTGIAEQQVDLGMKHCHVFDAGQEGSPSLQQAACEGEWHYICKVPC